MFLKKKSLKWLKKPSWLACGTSLLWLEPGVWKELAPTNKPHPDTWSRQRGSRQIVRTIDPTTGLVTDIGASVTHLDALAVQPVPEPGVMALLSLGGGMVLLVARRKAK
jgi:hypothetical protein